MRITQSNVNITIEDLMDIQEYFETVKEDLIYADTIRDAIEALEALKPYAD